MSTSNPPRDRPAGRRPIDPLLAQRLEQLSTRRPAGAALPPPTPGTVGQPTARPAAARSAVATAPRPGRRTKPARGAKVASLAVSVATTAALAGMFAGQDGAATDSVILTGGTAAGTDPTTTTAATTVTAAVGTTDPATANTDTATTAAATATATIVDGTYVGDASQNRWGVVQVQAVYSGGQLVDVQILSYPDGDGKSVRINQSALPLLIDESLNARGADINGVSGATYTSRSYVESLQSAIDTAKAASGLG